MKSIRTVLLLLTFLAVAAAAPAQAPRQPNSAEIHQAIKKLNVLCSALYVAAHPDDENTNLITNLANSRHYETYYLSVTRGDGGQNLIGSETLDLLGVIRTQELLAARRVDGGRQSFTRANDFGYSKSPDETLKIWDKQEVLSDVVWAIRRFQPDVIITRFPHTTERPNHGHHTASAILAQEAFDLAGRDDAFPEQLSAVQPWQARRIALNTSWWWYGSQEAFAKVDKSKWVMMNIGSYFAFKGKSNREIAAESRSQHRCQGMGTMSERGVTFEYFQPLKGDPPVEDLFSGIDTRWTRVKGGAPIGDLLRQIDKNYDYNNPGNSVPKLLEAMQLIEALPDGHWKRIKLEEIREVIKDCMGLYLEATATDYSAAPGDSVTVNVEVTNRCIIQPKLKSVELYPGTADTLVNELMEYHKPYKFKLRMLLPASTGLTSHYWLNEAHSPGMYNVKSQQLRGLPETPRALRAKIVLALPLNDKEYDIEWPVDVAYKWEDNVKGELFRPFEVIPPVFVNLGEESYVFAGNTPQQVKVKVQAGKAKVQGTVALKLPDGWRSDPSLADFQLRQKGEEQTLTFKVTPAGNTSEGTVSAVATVDNKTYDRQVVTIRYDHIPVQTVLRPSTARAARVELKTVGKNIGYIMGAGDEIPASLTEIGYNVTLLGDNDINPENLQRFDAVITGIRAYNTNEKMKFHQPKLYDYVEKGGTLIVQYNNSFELYLDELAPYKMKLSRDRVTVEDAEVRFLKPDHPVLNTPNKITAADFKGWIQERGLYFANEWDKDKLEAILSCNDPGESPKDGGLLVGKYGKGHYVFTAYAWFRQLPGGVPGAYRLFANLVALGKTK